MCFKKKKNNRKQQNVWFDDRSKFIHTMGWIWDKLKAHTHKKIPLSLTAQFSFYIM